MIRRLTPTLALLAALFLAGCSTTMDVTPATTAITTQARWVVLPFANHTSEPQAALRAEAISESLLRTNGVARLQRYPASLNQDSVFAPADRRNQSEASQWAAGEGYRYALTGTVDEWSYKVGVDGEPAVGFTLQVVDLTNQRVIWSAAGAKSGWSRQALSAVAQQLLREMLEQLPLQGQ